MTQQECLSESQSNLSAGILCFIYSGYLDMVNASSVQAVTVMTAMRYMANLHLLCNLTFIMRTCNVNNLPKSNWSCPHRALSTEAFVWQGHLVNSIPNSAFLNINDLKEIQRKMLPESVQKERFRN